jgi:hypothetical protein
VIENRSRDAVDAGVCGDFDEYAVLESLLEIVADLFVRQTPVARVEDIEGGSAASRRPV